MGYFRGCFSAFSLGRSLAQRIVVHQHGGQLGAVGGAGGVQCAVHAADQTILNGPGESIPAEPGQRSAVGEGLVDPADAGLKIAPGGAGQIQFKMLIRQ